MQELAARKVDFVKIWVDDRDGKYKKLTPDLYGAIIDEAHKNGSASPRISLRSKTRKGFCARASTRLRTACAIATSTRKVWRCSSSMQTLSSRRTCPTAAWRPT